MNTRWTFKLFSVLLLALLASNSAPLSAQEESKTAETKKAEQPAAVSVGDPGISLEHLKLMVKPLTRGELAIEAEAWRNLLKAKVIEISKLQVGVKQEQAKSVQAEATAASKPGEQETQAPEAQAPENTKAVLEAEKAKVVAAGKQAELTESLPELQEDRSDLIDRLNVVLDAWQAKGGDPEEYRQYATAVGGIDVDISDAATTWTVLWGWASSEKGGQRWLWNIAKFLALALVFYILSVIGGRITERLADRIKGASVLLKKFLASFVRQLVLVVGFIVAASALEVNISPLLAAIGGAAFVIGLALQGTLSNFASGLLILGYRPFDVGDVIETAGINGIVDSMNLISTKIRTFDNKVMIVPNNKIATDTITNATASTTRRVDMTFGIGYEDDITKAKAILESVVKQHDLVLREPAPVIQLNELADSSVNFIVRPWSKTVDYWTVYWDVTQKVKEAFDQNDISIPFPQRDIHVYQEKMANASNSNARDGQTA